MRELVAYSEQLPQDCKIARLLRSLKTKSCGSLQLSLTNSRKINQQYSLGILQSCNLAGVNHHCKRRALRFRWNKLPQYYALGCLRGEYSRKITPWDVCVGNLFLRKCNSLLAIMRETLIVSPQLPEDCPTRLLGNLAFLHSCGRW